MFADWFNNYSVEKFKKDLLSGVIVGVIAIPLGMAFAIASGVKPEYGIYTTIIAGILVSLFGGSRFQISGPTGAFIPLLFGIVATYGYDGLLIAGFMAGIMLVLMGVFKLGVLIKYIPRPVTIGFTAGIAVTIFIGQVSKFLGLDGVASKEYFHENLHEIITHFSTIDFFSIITALICLLTIILTPKFAPKIPAAIIGIIFSTVIATIFFPDKVATIGSAYGTIPSTLPKFSFFDVNLSQIIELIRPAFTIAMLCAIESLLSAVVADGMTNTRHNSNKELIGQGIANMITPLFGGIPATGAIARTATNIKTGAQTRVAGVIHGIVVLLTLIILAPYASMIPLASLAPVLMVVAWNMSERKEFIHILKTKTGDSIVLMLTFVLTVFVNLTVAVEVGLLLAVILFAKRMSEVFKVHHVLPDINKKGGKISPNAVTDSHYCPQISMFDVEGSLFFGAAETFVYYVLDSIHLHPKVVILKMNKLIHLDTTGENNLKSIISQLKKNDCQVLIAGLHGQPLEIVKLTGLYNEIGKQHFFHDTNKAIHYGISLISNETCHNCRHFAFKECKKLSCVTIKSEQSAGKIMEDQNEYGDAAI
ncbi:MULTISPECIES: SulP family inorganic anion transporter [Bacillus]|uniref:SulP family inorganic anion transporter n=1 Tax=Bacillus TaxID=1386 RepID=UPI0002E411A5|nr:MULTISPECIES: sulfate permease [Bacillus]